MFRIKDRLVLVVIAGFLAAIPGMITLHLLNFVFPGRYINMPLISLEVFLNVTPLSTLKIILGIISTFVISGFYALIYMVALDLTGWKYMLIKAFSILNGGWFLFANGVMRLLNIGTVYRDEPLSISAFYLAHLFYAFYLYLTFKLFGTQEQEITERK